MNELRTTVTSLTEEIDRLRIQLSTRPSTIIAVENLHPNCEAVAAAFSESHIPRFQTSLSFYTSHN